MFVINRSLNYAGLVEFNYSEYIYYIVRLSLLETSTGVSKCGNFITK